MLHTKKQKVFTKTKTDLSSKQDTGTKTGQEVRKQAKRREHWRGWKSLHNRTYDLAVTSTYWPGRKCAAYRGVPEHKTVRIALLNLYSTYSAHYQNVTRSVSRVNITLMV